MRLRVRFLGPLLLVLLCLTLFPPVAAASGWSKTFGDPDASEEAYGVVATSDGGFVVGGSVNWINPHGVLVNQWDTWLMKVNEGGNMLWNRTYGNGQAANSSLFWMETASALVATSDGGFALAGSVGLWPGDIGAPNGSDFWLIKTDGNGNMLWNRSYGNPGNGYMEYARSMIVLADGGYMLAGTVGPYGGTSDFWVIKTDSVGNMVWNKTISTGGMDRVPSIVSALDGGYMVSGVVNADSEGRGDVMLAKLDLSGNVQWNKTYSDPFIGSPMFSYALAASPDGGYVFGREIPGVSFLTKIDNQGNQLWDRPLGGPYEANCSVRAVVACADGGFVYAGWDRNLLTGRTHGLLWRVDASGSRFDNLMLSSYGDTEKRMINALTLTNDGGCILAGNYNAASGVSDVFLIKTNENVVVPELISFLALAVVLAVATPIVLAKRRLLASKH